MARTSGATSKPANYKHDRKDRRLSENQTGKRRCVTVMRERGGRTVTFVGKSELEAVPAIMKRVMPGTVIHADEATSWDGLGDHYDMRRINHSVCYSDGQACTNGAESFFSRLRGPNSAPITASGRATCPPMPVKWRGARITAAF